MTRYMWNFLIGALMIAGGLSGRFVLIGTNSGTALAALGAGVFCLGGYRLARARGVL